MDRLNCEILWVVGWLEVDLEAGDLTYLCPLLNCKLVGSWRWDADVIHFGSSFAQCFLSKLQPIKKNKNKNKKFACVSSSSPVVHLVASGYL